MVESHSEVAQPSDAVSLPSWSELSWDGRGLAAALKRGDASPIGLAAWSDQADRPHRARATANSRPVLLLLSGYGGTEAECASSHTRVSVIKIVSGNSDNALCSRHLP